MHLDLEEFLLHLIGIMVAAAAAILALQLIRITGTLKAWLLLAAGLVLLAIEHLERLLFHSGLLGQARDFVHLAFVDAVPVLSALLLLGGVVASRTIFLERKAGLEMLQEQLNRLRRSSPETDKSLDAGESALRQSLTTWGRSGNQVLTALELVKNEQRRNAQAQQEWRAAFDAVNAPIFLYDREYRLVRANRAYVERAGMSLKDMLGKPYFEVFPKLPSPISDPPHSSPQDLASHEFVLPTGEAFISKSLPLYDEDRQYRCSLHVLEETTQVRQTQKSNRRVKLALKVVTACLREIPQAMDATQMLEAICHAMVNSGFYRVAHAVRAQHDDSRSLATLSFHSLPATVPPLPLDTWSDAPEKRSVAAVAINSQKTCVVQDLLHAPEFGFCHRYAAKYHLVATIGLPLFRQGVVWGSLVLYSDETGAFSEEEIAVLDILGVSISFGLSMLHASADDQESLRSSVQQLDAMNRHLEQIIVALEIAIEARQPYGSTHQHLVGEIGMAIAQEMGLPPAQAYGVRLAGILHDVGKVKVPDEVLHRTGALSEEERQLIRQHPRAGYEVLSGVELPWPLARTVLQHHERLDGSGYPDGLKAQDILLEAKIVAVADVIEAMAYQRRDHPRLGLPAALAELERHKGTLFDPAVVDAALRLFREKGFQIQ